MGCEYCACGTVSIRAKLVSTRSPDSHWCDSASVRVGKTYVSADVAPEDVKVVLDIELEKGDFDKETAFKLPRESGEELSWGAYFV